MGDKPRGCLLVVVRVFLVKVAVPTMFYRHPERHATAPTADPLSHPPFLFWLQRSSSRSRASPLAISRTQTLGQIPMLIHHAQTLYQTAQNGTFCTIRTAPNSHRARAPSRGPHQLRGSWHRFGLEPEFGLRVCREDCQLVPKRLASSLNSENVLQSGLVAGPPVAKAEVRRLAGPDGYPGVRGRGRRPRA